MPLKVNFFCDIKDSFMHLYLPEYISKINKKYKTKYFKTTNNIPRGEIAFYISCSKILNEKDLQKHDFNIVVHPGKLPNERGSGVIAWKIINGSKDLTITLFEPNEKIDAGNIVLQKSIRLTGLELNNEIRLKQSKLTFKLIDKFLKQYPNIKRKKNNKFGSYFKKRTKNDSELDINKTIHDQFNLLRVCDNDRYPAFFRIKNKKYLIKIFNQ